MGSKTGVSLADCKGSLSQYNGNAFNYRPDTRECYIKSCEDETDAKSNLVSFSQPFDVYYCDSEYFIEGHRGFIGHGILRGIFFAIGHRTLGLRASLRHVALHTSYNFCKEYLLRPPWGVPEPHLNHACKPCFIAAIPSQTYQNK